jgi:hypothetical protein
MKTATGMRMRSVAWPRRLRAQEQIERTVMADPGIPDGYNRESVAASIASLVVAIGGSYRFVIRTLGDGVPGSDTYWSVHIARDARNKVQVASLPDIPIDQHLELIGRHEAALQAVMERAARADRLPEIAAARAALEASNSRSWTCSPSRAPSPRSCPSLTARSAKRSYRWMPGHNRRSRMGVRFHSSEPNPRGPAGFVR